MVCILERPETCNPCEGIFEDVAEFVTPQRSGCKSCVSVKETEGACVKTGPANRGGLMPREMGGEYKEVPLTELGADEVRVHHANHLVQIRLATVLHCAWLSLSLKHRL
jgi:hypothetical protein